MIIPNIWKVIKAHKTHVPNHQPVGENRLRWLFYNQPSCIPADPEKNLGQPWQSWLNHHVLTVESSVFLRTFSFTHSCTCSKRLQVQAVFSYWKNQKNLRIFLLPPSASSSGEPALFQPDWAPASRLSFRLAVPPTPALGLQVNVKQWSALLLLLAKPVSWENHQQNCWLPSGKLT